jgi:hypothetical protein
LKALLSISLVLNLALGIAFLVRNRAPVETPKAAAAIPKAAKAKPVTEIVVKPIDWRSVESDDYRSYVGNLRSIGCPEETIRDIIVADVNKLYEAKKQELNIGAPKFKYWKAGNPFQEMLNPDRLEKIQALAREKRALLKVLLGAAPEEKPDLFAGSNPFEAMLDFLPPAKQTQVMDLLVKLQARTGKILRNGSPDAGDLKEVQRLKKEADAELAQVLTPEEKQQYDLRMSDTAMAMRMQLGAFDATEQEFLKVFQLRKAYDDQFGAYGSTGLGRDDASRDAAQRQLNDQLKQALGDERYADYVRSQDYTYQGLAKLVEREGLPADTASKVYDVKQIAEDKTRQVKQDNSLSPEQQQAALQAIRAETESTVRATLGDQAFQSYQNQPGAIWLKNISSRPR